MRRLLPPLCWTGLIAYFGGEPWGGAQTAAWLGPLLGTLLPFASSEQLATVHVLIRKRGQMLGH